MPKASITVVRFGIGYGTEENARADAEYHHLNFFGGARTAGVHARWSSLDRGLRVDFTQPYVFGPHMSLNAEGQRWYTDTPAYTSTVTGGKIALNHRASASTVWSISMTHERESSTIADDVLNDLTLRDELIALGLDPRTGEQAGTIAAAGFDFQRSTVDNLLDARHGYQLDFHAEQAGRVLGGSFEYTLLSGDIRHYLPLGDRLVLASRLQSGNLRPSGGSQTDVPFSKRYFLGGSTSVRGWGRYELSPLSDSGLPIGGNSMLEASGELRASLFDKLSAVLFIDGGNVWANSQGIRFERLAVRGRARNPLPDARGASAVRLRVPVESDSQSGRQWRAADPAVAHPLQHRTGVLTVTADDRPPHRTEMVISRQRRVMRIVGRLLRILVLTLMLVVAAAAASVVVMETAWFKNRLRDYMVREANQDLNGTLSIGRLGGNLFSGVALEQVAVAMDGEQVVKIEAVRLSYDVFEMVSNGVSIARISLNGPAISLERKHGAWTIARLVKKRREQTDRTGTPRPIDIRHIEITDGSVAVSGQDPDGAPKLPHRFDHIDAALALTYRSARYTVDVAHVSFRASEPAIGLNALSGSIAVDDGQISLRNIAVRTEESSLSIDGTIQRTSPKPFLDLAINAGKLSLPEIAPIVPALRGIPLQPAFEVKLNGPTNRLAIEMAVRSAAGQVSGTLIADLAQPDQSVSGNVVLRHLDLAPIIRNPDGKSDISGKAAVKVHGVAPVQHRFAALDGGARVAASRCARLRRVRCECARADCRASCDVQRPGRGIWRGRDGVGVTHLQR